MLLFGEGQRQIAVIEVRRGSIPAIGNELKADSHLGPRETADLAWPPATGEP
jgi:hypothetical protein